jgi:hypothetical protein
VCLCVVWLEGGRIPIRRVRVCGSVCGSVYLKGGCVCVVMCVVRCVVMYTYKEVVELDVAVHNARGMTVLEARDDLGEQTARLMLRQPVTLAVRLVACFNRVLGSSRTSFCLQEDQLWHTVGQALVYSRTSFSLVTPHAPTGCQAV